MKCIHIQKKGICVGSILLGDKNQNKMGETSKTKWGTILKWQGEKVPQNPKQKHSLMKSYSRSRTGSVATSIKTYQ